MFGYCSMGNVLMQMKPTSVMTIAIAHAITYLLINIFPFIIADFQLEKYFLSFLYVVGAYGDDAVTHVQA